MKSRKKNKPARRRPASSGYAVEFHGAFSTEAKAKAKARKIGGFYKKSHPPMQSKPRWVVMLRQEDKVPF